VEKPSEPRMAIEVGPRLAMAESEIVAVTTP